MSAGELASRYLTSCQLNNLQRKRNEPNIVYKKDWISWGDWLGNEYRSFTEARKYAHSLGLKSIEEWKKWCKSGNKPEDIPARPDHVYKEWISYADFLVAVQNPIKIKVSDSCHLKKLEIMYVHLD
jgi:hypothetical protein